MPEMPPQIFDRRQRRLCRARAADKIDSHGFLFDHAVKEILENLSMVTREFSSVLQIGLRPYALDIAHVGMDVSPLLCRGSRSVVADEDFLPFASGSFDLIISPLSLHSVNDLPGALIQIRRTLKPDGLFLAAIFGGETLYQLRDALGQAEMELTGGLSPRLFPFADLPQMASLMQRAGFTLPVADSEKITVTYPSLTKMMHDLRYMGENNILTQRRKTIPSRRLFSRAEEIYREIYAEHDGRLPATFEIIYLTGWSAHDSQQKPLRPGTAQHSLAEALETEEITTGDTAQP